MRRDWLGDSPPVEPVFFFSFFLCVFVATELSHWSASVQLGGAEFPAPAARRRRRRLRRSVVDQFGTFDRFVSLAVSPSRLVIGRSRTNDEVEADSVCRHSRRKSKFLINQCGPFCVRMPLAW